jgi:hypothetical protein
MRDDDLEISEALIMFVCKSCCTTGPRLHSGSNTEIGCTGCQRMQGACLVLHVLRGVYFVYIHGKVYWRLLLETSSAQAVRSSWASCLSRPSCLL